MHESDEDEERQRQMRERADMSIVDRIHGSPARKNASGFTDLRSYQRTGRVVQLPLRVHPKTRAIIDAIMIRDRHPSVVSLFEVMLNAYQEVYGAIPEDALPTEEELVRRLEEERDKRDAR
jgi:hypothetical protein